MDKIKKIYSFIKCYYLFVLAVFLFFIGFDLLSSSSWSYNPTDAENIANNIRAGLKNVSGAILIGASLMSLSIQKWK
jgi:hypothetical protein